MGKFAWSFSALNSFETCPFRYKETRITKRIVEPQTEALLWGNRVHKELENYIRSNKPLTKELEAYKPLADKIIQKARDSDGKLDAEQKVALTKNLTKTTFFANNVWVRGIVDVTIENGDKVFVGDWKTGKRNPDSEQLMLSAAMVMGERPWINKVTNAFIWLKTDEIDHETFTRDDLPGIWENFLPRVERMEQAIQSSNYPARESGLCKNWCPVHHCLYNGHYKPKS